MKKTNKKSIVLLAMVLLILFGTVGGTIAWIIADTKPVQNTFTPGKVTVNVDDTVSDNVKSNVEITNTGNVKAYIRAAIVANWVLDGKIVAPWKDTDGTFSGLPGSGWVQNGDYYYYTSPVEPGAETSSALFSSYTAPVAPVEGAKLEMVIVAQAIQAEGTTTNGTKAVVDAWGIDPESLGGSSATN